MAAIAMVSPAFNEIHPITTNSGGRPACVDCRRKTYALKAKGQKPG
jgi:hypothetical protein